MTYQTQFVSQRICPVFQVSNVTGESLDLVREFLNILPHHGNYNADAPFEFHINDTFSVPFVGTVVSGVVKNGKLLRCIQSQHCSSFFLPLPLFPLSVPFSSPLD